ncbi:MioC protein [Brevibacterium sandarakinum]|uniref:MioC protein n=1 Tax=Brevibacterium sandarakinum TaxID=629680 RepID=A0A1H1SL10_BRESA|nr:flavodoxin domain-containing protein [Brevibacterium sandarakinum]SDS48675.1 MioC protein [Brevibacterium sandarakinum]
MKINIIFGTESGESEFVADDIAEALSKRFDVSVENMKDVDVDAIDFHAFYLVVCSTYGEGDMPSSAEPFHRALSAGRPDLSMLQYAMFGRGDSTYAETYSQGSEHVDRLLTELGATRVGEYGREDAGDWDTPEDIAVQWAEVVVKVREGEDAVS